MQYGLMNAAVGRLKLHDYACLIHENEHEWQETVISFIAEGLGKNEQCVYIVNRRIKQIITERLAANGIDVCRYEARGQLIIIHLNEILAGLSSHEALDKIYLQIVNFLKQSGESGYPAIRVTGEEPFIVDKPEQIDYLVELNARIIDQLLNNYPLLFLWHYDLYNTDPLALKYALLIHPIIIMNNNLYSNLPCKDNLELVLKAGGRWEVEHWLSVLEQKNRMAHALEQSIANFRLIAENSQDLISVVDSETLTYKYVSPSHFRLMGYTEEELLGANCMDVIHSEDIVHVINALTEGLEKGEGTANYRVKKKDGVYTWLETSGMYINYDKAKPDILLVCRDISIRKSAELALEKSEEKYRLIVDNAYDGIAIADIATLKYSFTNPALMKMLGSQDLIGHDILYRLYPPDYPKAMEALQQCISTGEGTAQFRWVKPDGTLLWLDITAKVVDQNGEPSQILFISRDISLRKKAEEALLASENALRNSEEQLKEKVDYLSYLIENMNEMFVTYDIDRKITSVNSTGCTASGYTADELIGQDLMILIPDYLKEEVAQRVVERLGSRTPYSFEMPLLNKSGLEVITKIKTNPIIENGQIVGGMVLVDDMTEYRQMQKKMARLDQLNTIGEMAAGIGHEIRNPMTAVTGFLQIMSNSVEFSQYKHYFDIMLQEMEQANMIISEFLSLAKNRLVVLQMTNLNSIINSLYPLLKADAVLGDKAIKLHLGDIPKILADEKEMRQLLINLVRNGLEAMSPGGAVYIRTYMEDDKVVLSVRDEGCGIDKDIMEKLGTPFLTTKENGTGLGLAICHSIIARHNAEIEHETGSAGTNIIVRFNLPDTESSSFLARCAQMNEMSRIYPSSSNTEQ